MYFILCLSSFVLGWCFKEDLLNIFITDFPRVRLFIYNFIKVES